MLIELPAMLCFLEFFLFCCFLSLLRAFVWHDSDVRGGGKEETGDDDLRIC